MCLESPSGSFRDGRWCSTREAHYSLGLRTDWIGSARTSDKIPTLYFPMAAGVFLAPVEGNPNHPAPPTGAVELADEAAMPAGTPEYTPPEIMVVPQLLPILLYVARFFPPIYMYIYIHARCGPLTALLHASKEKTHIQDALKIACPLSLPGRFDGDEGCRIACCPPCQRGDAPGGPRLSLPLSLPHTPHRTVNEVPFLCADRDANQLPPSPLEPRYGGGGYRFFSQVPIVSYYIYKPHPQNRL